MNVNYVWEIIKVHLHRTIANTNAKVMPFLVASRTYFVPCKSGIASRLV